MAKIFFPAALLALVLAGAGCSMPSTIATNVAVIPAERDETVSSDVAAIVAADLARGDVLVPNSDSVANLPDDVDIAQIGAKYLIGANDDAIEFAFVLQKNMNVPLLNLPANKETTWGGVIARGAGQDGWTKFLAFENPRVEEVGTVRANPVGMFVENGKLYVDVADALGAGSGEGQMARFVLGADGKSWKSGGCWYYVPEKYVAAVDEPLKVSKDCVVVP